MNSHLRSIALLAMAVLSPIFTTLAQTPLSMNGKLKLVGNQLSNACGDPVQLRGVSTHTPMGHQNCYTQQSVETIANDWKADVLRLAMYTDVSQGTDYIDNPAQWDLWIDQMVDFAEDNGMYVILDWHILEDEDPLEHQAEARTFFSAMSAKYANRDHVIYEICNEPNGWVDWNRIRTYAEDMIPRIRANDSEAIIVVGTPGWSSRPGDVWSNPLSSSNRHNVMYAYHFYAGSHYDYDYLKNVLGSLPIFVSEWGTTAASGNWGYDENSSNTWLNILDGNNAGGVTVSSCNWSFSDKDESSASLTAGSCALSNWSSRTQSGNYVRNYLRETDNFTQCQALADDDNDGVLNKDDQCPNTPPGDNVNAIGCTAPLLDADNDGISDNDDECPGTTPGATVNLYGCEIFNDFVNNSCFGVNNYQGYARDDFSRDGGYANLTWWAIDGTNPVYFAEVQNGELAVDVTAADPNYATFGVSFGQDGNSELITIDISHEPVVQMDVFLSPTGTYASTSAIIDIVIEDDQGNQLNADALQNVQRKTVSLNQWTTLTANFENGYRESWEAGECAGSTPCYFNTFDFTKLTKVILWLNPGAGEAWSRPEFTGNWNIDNFSVGYDEQTTEACLPFRDDDGDGVAQEDDKCQNTPANETPDADGCAQSQLDDDNDGVNNVADACPATNTGATVDASGCAESQKDDDVDGVDNVADLCPDTPENDPVDTDGCGQTQLDDDNDGVMNNEDLCANTPPGVVVDSDGCTIVGLESFNSAGLKLYPVPASDFCVIEQTQGQFDQLEILDLAGTVVASHSLKANSKISTNDLAPGTYIFRLVGANGSEQVKMIVE